MDISMELFMEKLDRIGGIARCGQPGFCMLYVLWTKACELGSLSFTMSNTELLYKAGFCKQKRFYEVRKELMEKGFLKFLGVDGSKSMVSYKLNLLTDGISGNRIDSRIDNGIDSRIDSGIDNGIDSRIDNGIDSGIDNRIDSGIDNRILGLKDMAASFSRRNT